MRIALLFAALLVAAPAAAQDSGAPPSQDPAETPAYVPPPPPSGGDQGGGQSGDGSHAGGDARSTRMTAADARVNIASIVQAFVAAHSRDGAWALRDKSDGRVRRLSLQKVDENTTQSAGGQRFKVAASLRDLDSEETLRSQFFVDFSGPEWRVVGLRLFEPRKGAKGGRASASRAD